MSPDSNNWRKLVAAERLDMRCVRDVLRLHFVLRQSPTSIAQSEGCGRTTVRDYVTRANKSGLTDWGSIEKLNDQELEIRLGFKTFAHATWLSEKVMPDWSAVHHDLQANKSVTMALLCQEYLEENPQGYRYTQFCEHYNRWARKLSVVMRQARIGSLKPSCELCSK
jgi:hypothetical protein